MTYFVQFDLTERDSRGAHISRGSVCSGSIVCSPSMRHVHLRDVMIKHRITLGVDELNEGW